MNQRLIFVGALVVATVIAVQAQKYIAQSATTSAGWHPTPTAAFIASSDKTFNQLMSEAMNIMHRDMHSAEYSSDADHDFVTMMIPHHQGAIDMAKALLLYGKDPQMRRLAQEIITDQQSEIQLMQLWLKQHRTSSQTQTPKRGLDARKN